MKFSKKCGKKLFPDYEEGNPGSWSRSESSRVIFWDFDGTLAYRPGEWRGCLIEVLDEYEPRHGITSEAIRPHLQEGFPWHRPAHIQSWLTLMTGGRWCNRFWLEGYEQKEYHERDPRRLPAHFGCTISMEQLRGNSVPTSFPFSLGFVKDLGVMSLCRTTCPNSLPSLIVSD